MGVLTEMNSPKKNSENDILGRGKRLYKVQEMSMDQEVCFKQSNTGEAWGIWREGKDMEQAGVVDQTRKGFEDLVKWFGF